MFKDIIIQIFNKYRSYNMRDRNANGSVFLLQIFIALFFALSGLLYLTGYNTAGSQFIRGVGKLLEK